MIEVGSEMGTGADSRVGGTKAVLYLEDWTTVTEGQSQKAEGGPHRRKSETSEGSVEESPGSDPCWCCERYRIMSTVEVGCYVDNDALLSLT